MAKQTYNTRVPQQGDSIETLLAKGLSLPERGTLLASAARTATTFSSVIDLAGARAIALFLNVSSASGTGGLRVGLQYLDPESGTWLTLVNFDTAALTATGTRVYCAGIGIGTIASGTASGFGSIAGVPLTSQMRIAVTHLDASSYTYSIGYEIA